MSIRRALILAMIILMAGMVSGCAIGDPGGSVHRAMEQSLAIGWDSNGNYIMTGEGSQELNTIMAQGNVSITVDEDGKPQSITASDPEAYVVITSPSSDEVAGGLNAMAQISVAQTQSLQQSFDNLISLVVPLIGQRQTQKFVASTQPSGGSSVGGADQWDEMYSAIRLMIDKARERDQ